MVTLDIKSVCLSSFLKKVELIDPKLKTKFFSLFIDAGGMPDVLCPCFKLAIISCLKPLFQEYVMFINLAPINPLTFLKQIMIEANNYY